MTTDDRQAKIAAARQRKYRNDLWVEEEREAVAKAQARLERAMHAAECAGLDLADLEQSPPTQPATAP